MLVNYVILLTLGVIWGSSFLFLKLALESFEPFTLGAMRLLIGGSMIVGLVLVVVSARVLIADVKQICTMMSIPESIISATVVAFGTSLPELVTALTSIKKNHPELLVGNIVGANILNILFVVGASSAATELVVPPEVLYLHIPTMILIMVLFRVFSATRKDSFSNRCGIPLLLIYIAFIVACYLTGQAVQ